MSRTRLKQLAIMQRLALSSCAKLCRSCSTKMRQSYGRDQSWSSASRSIGEMKSEVKKDEGQMEVDLNEDLLKHEEQIELN